MNTADGKWNVCRGKFASSRTSLSFLWTSVEEFFTKRSYKSIFQTLHNFNLRRKSKGRAEDIVIVSLLLFCISSSFRLNKTWSEWIKEWMRCFCFALAPLALRDDCLRRELVYESLIYRNNKNLQNRKIKLFNRTRWAWNEDDSTWNFSSSSCPRGLVAISTERDGFSVPKSARSDRRKLDTFPERAPRTASRTSERKRSYKYEEVETVWYSARIAFFRFSSRRKSGDGKTGKVKIFIHVNSLFLNLIQSQTIFMLSSTLYLNTNFFSLHEGKLFPVRQFSHSLSSFSRICSLVMVSYQVREGLEHSANKTIDTAWMRNEIRKGKNGILNLFAIEQLFSDSERESLASLFPIAHQKQISNSFVCECSLCE